MGTDSKSYPQRRSIFLYQYAFVVIIFKIYVLPRVYSNAIFLARKLYQRSEIIGERFFASEVVERHNVCKDHRVKSIQFCKQIGLILTTNNQIYSGTIAS